MIKNDKEKEQKFWDAVEIFILNPFDSCLKSHKLSGKLKEQWSFTVEYNVRVLFYFVDKQKVVFTDRKTR